MITKTFGRCYGRSLTTGDMKCLLSQIPVYAPLSEEEVCPCAEGQACSDIILSDVNMLIKDGLRFIEEQIEKGCRCNRIALMSGAFSDESVSKANSLGIKTFEKPFKISEMISWLDQIEKDVEPKRKLSDWFLNRIPQNTQN